MSAAPASWIPSPAPEASAAARAADRLLDAAIALARITPAELQALGAEFDPAEAQRVADELRRAGFAYVQRVAVETEARLGFVDELPTPLPGLVR